MDSDGGEAGKGRRLATIVEIVTGISVVVTLVLLLVEVRANTGALERQIRMDQAQSVAEPVLDDGLLRSAYRKVKERDGWEPEVTAFMDEYGLTEEESIAWTRFLYWAWVRREADFTYLGRDPSLAASIHGLLIFPDNQLYWDTGRDGFSEEFQAWVDEIRATLPPATSGASVRSDSMAGAS